MHLNVSLKYRIAFFVVLFFLVISIFEWIIGLFNNSEGLTYFYIAQLFTVYVLSYYHCYKELGVLHIFSLLYATTFIFAFGSLAMSLISPDFDFRQAYSPLEMKFNEVVIQKAILLYCVYLSSTYLLFFYLRINKFKKSIPYEEMGTDSLYLKTGKTIMLFCFPFALWYAYTMFTLLLGNRTLMYSSGSSEELGIPLYLRFANYFFSTGYYMLVASLPKRKTFVIFTLLYLITLLPLLLTGERGTFVIPLIFLLWYQNKVYGKEIKILPLVGIAASIMVISYVISFTRLGHTVTDIPIVLMIILFMGSSSTSFTLLCYYITFKDQVMAHPYPFIFDSLIGGLTGHYGQSMDTLEHRASIGHQLVYELNQDYYLSGGSTGTSLIAEGFEYGVIGVIIASIFLIFAIMVVERIIFKKRFYMIFLFLIFGSVILSPRSSIFIGIYDIIKFSILSWGLLKLFSMFHKNRKLSGII